MSKRSSVKRTVLVKELYARHRHQVLLHLLSLDAEDRFSRFGTHVSDEAISHYVKGIDFQTDKIFGVFSYRFHLISVGHLSITNKAHPPEGGLAEPIAELGLSVSKSARGHGIGAGLFKRARIHCRNANFTLYLHFLRSNKVMMHLAKKAGMTLHHHHDEFEAYLKSPPSSTGTILQETLHHHIARFDYSMKKNARSLLNFFKTH